MSQNETRAFISFFDIPRKGGHYDIGRSKNFFQQDKFATCAAGIVLKELDENGAVCTMAITDNHLNAVGSVMGGALFTLADFGFAAAANFKGMGTVTLSSQIQFLSGAKGNILTAVTRPVKEGRHACFYETEITDELGTKIAVVSASGYRR